MPLYQPVAGIDIRLESFLVKKNTISFFIDPPHIPCELLKTFCVAFLRKTDEKLPDFIIIFSVVFKKQLLTAKMQ